jgi:hypothetical protein
MSDPAPSDCPLCDDPATAVVEDVSDEVTVFGCTACGATWADRADRADRADCADRADRADRADCADRADRPGLGAQR